MRGYLPLSLLLVTACTQGATEEDPSVAAVETAAPFIVEIQQADFAYGMPSEIPSGWITFRAPNLGKEHHVAVFLRLPEGVTRADWYEAMADPQTARNRDWWGGLEDAGGTGVVAPGETAETIMKMEPGLYGVLCGVIAADGTSHWVHGMHTTFEVTSEQSGASEPVADIRLSLGENGLEQEGVVAAGRQVVAVHFADQPEGATHDVHVARLEAGQTLEAAIQLMDRPIEPFPMNFVGGAEQAPEGRTDYFVIDFEPGRYAWVCHLHASNGMAQEFIVE
jgi:plastocyanin